MGTRGVFGFRANQADVLFYNHFDSYPEGLGNDVVEYCRQVADWDEVRNRVLEFQPAEGKPTPQQKQRARELGTIDLGVSGQSEDDFYCLTREAQGNIEKTLALGFGQLANGFPADSLFCEYGYVMNLDTMELELYEGFNKDRSADGRYAGTAEESEEYAGIKLVGTCSLTNIPDNWQEFFPHDEEDAA